MAIATIIDNLIVDAACASSLIAIHLGSQAILSGDSTVALCGGVNVLCAPGLTHMLEQAGALASDGLCASFDDDAHGYARGEGGAIVVLKKLSSAIADNDNIVAVLKGTATAQDGKTNGIMAPNARAQEIVARKALLRAGGLDPLTVGYVEAHATATSLGDLTEIGAISRVYGEGRDSENPCAIGSIKPNVGHLEAAAGAIGFVKAVLAVDKGELAPQALLKTLNTRIDWENSGLSVVQEASTWPTGPGIRRAAVCSYGYGGSVAHAIIEQRPASHQDARDMAEKRMEDMAAEPVVLVLSSFQKKRLPMQAVQLAKWLLSEGREVNLRAVAATLAQRRTTQDHRAAFVVESHLEAIEALQLFAAGESSQWIASNRVIGSPTERSVVWVFSGHGAQWANMGKKLLKTPTFYRTIAALEGLIEREAGFSAMDALREGSLGSASTVQVLTYLMQIGLAGILQSKGVKPQAVMGHSTGEIAAAVVAGCLTPSEGALLVSRRARLYKQFEGHGGMALTKLSFSQVKVELQGRTDVVAAIASSPSSCVVSGEMAPLKQYLRQLAQRGIETFRVKTDVAFHSPMLEKLIAPLKDALDGGIAPRAATIPIYSTSHANPRTETDRDIHYWVNNMVLPVRLYQTVGAAIEDGNRIFLEVSSHPIVAHSIRETLAVHGVHESAVFSVMQRDTSSERSVLQAVAQLHAAGVSVDFETQLGTSSWATNVPGTPWVQKPYWKLVETGDIHAVRQHDVKKHTLLGHCTDVAGSETLIFTTNLDEKTKPYPLTHPLNGTEVVPAAVYCNTFRHATDATVLRNLQLRSPTPITADQREVQVVVQGDSLQLCSRLKQVKGTEDNSQHPWTNHVTCKWSKEDTVAYEEVHDIELIEKRISTKLSNGFSLEHLQKVGVSGIAYPWAVLSHYGNEKEMLARVDMDPEHNTIIWDRHSWAPVMDAATSIGSSIFYNDPKMRVVSGIDQVVFISQKAPPKISYLYVQNTSDSCGLVADIGVLNETGRLLAKLISMRFSDVEAVPDRTTGMRALVHQLAWVPPQFAEVPLTLDRVLLVCDDVELSRAYADGVQGVAKEFLHADSVESLKDAAVSDFVGHGSAVIVYVPCRTEALSDVPDDARRLTWEATRILQHVSILATTRLFIVTDSVYKADSPTALAQSPLYGFSRIAAQEYPEAWGGLIDNESPSFPVLTVKYVRGHDVVRIEDGLPRVARLRPFTKRHRNEAGSATLLPKIHGTYLVTGGFGDVGLEVLDFLVRKGARRIVVVSRNALPPRRKWTDVGGRMKAVVDKVIRLETQGASIYSVSLDIGSSDAELELIAALDRLGLPPILGVVHAAGVNEDGLIKDVSAASVCRVFAPKVAGALTLHRLFPPASLDFFVLFSSIGQLIGTPGQAPYGAANAFLDALATYRRRQNDNAIAIQWTAWQNMGLAADSAFLTAELNSKGLSDITCDEGFQAWEYLESLNTDHAVVTRARILDANEPLPSPLLSDIAPRCARPAIPTDPTKTSESGGVRPTAGPELKIWLSTKIRECIGAVLHMDIEDIDPRTAIADLGVDSVISIALRQKFQSVLGVRVPPTLMWKEPNVRHLASWCQKQIEKYG